MLEDKMIKQSVNQHWFYFFQVSGCGLLGIGIWICVDDRIEEFLKNASIGFPLDWIYVFAYVTIGVGGFIFITGFCGCCGAVRESAWMLAGVRT